jgi:hypothetical protein
MVTMFLANIIGWFLVLVSLLLILRYEHFKSVASDIMAHPGLFFIWAIIAVILGLIMVSSHNIWIIGWPVVVTIFSWMVLVGGLMRLFFPEEVIKIGRTMLKGSTKIHIMGILWLIIGIFLLMHVHHIYF